MTRFFSSITLLLTLATLGVGCADGQSQNSAPSNTNENTQSVLEFSRHGVEYDYYDGQIQLTGEYWYSPQEMFGTSVCFDPDTESNAKLPVGGGLMCFRNSDEAIKLFGIRTGVYSPGQSCSDGGRARATIVIEHFSAITLQGVEGSDQAILVGAVSHDTPRCQQ